MNKKIKFYICLIFILIFLSSTFSYAIKEEEQSPIINIQNFSSENQYFNGSYVLIDVQLNNIKQLQTYCKQGTIQELAKDVDAIFAINGDFWNYQHQYKVIVRNGQLLYDLEYNQSIRDYCVITYDGEMQIYLKDEYEQLPKNNCWQLFSFGPALVKDGKAITDFSNIWDKDLLWSHPRSAIGYYEKNHFCFLIVNGRTPELKNNGAYLEQMSIFFKELGCQSAYSLDGGSLSHALYMGEELGISTNQKEIADIIYIRKNS